MEKGEITVIGHVEGSESGVGVAEHGIDSSVAVDAAPPAAGLPHPVQDSEYRQGMVAVLHRGNSRALLLGGCRAHASYCGGSKVRSGSGHRRLGYEEARVY